MPDADNINFALGDIMSISRRRQRWRYVGAFLPRLNYAYDDLYLLEVNGRYDGSSLPNNSQWGFFPRLRPPGAFRRRSSGTRRPKGVRTSSCAPRTVRGNSNVVIPTPTYLGLSTFGTGSGRCGPLPLRSGQAALHEHSRARFDNIGWETSKPSIVGLDAPVS